MEIKSHTSHYLLTVGIDFGTSHCAVAYSYRNSPEDIHVFRHWLDGTPTLGKVPTSILFDENEKCLEFGYGAVRKFKELVHKEEHEDVYFFQNFKMKLYEERNITENMLLQDTSGKEMKAMDVFTAAFKYMKNQVLSHIKHRRCSLNVTERKTKWVITVPAIWCDAAKQFMRKAAERAGCRSRSLVVALEPEAAAIYCQHSWKEKEICSNIFENENGAKYMVIDNGGGTVDVTAHEITKHGYLKEIYRASGGSFGGEKVNKHLERLLQTLFTKQNVNAIKEGYPDEWLHVMEEFQTIKKQLGPNDCGDNRTVSIQLSTECPWNKNYLLQLPDSVKQGVYMTKRGRLFFPAALILSMVEHVSWEIRDHISKILEEPGLENLDCIIMVGGFSNSRVVVDDIKELVECDNVPVVVPEDAELSVVKGAVIFGWKRDLVQSRKSRKTYGISISDWFIAGFDDESRAFFDADDKKWCIDCFCKLVSINDEVSVNDMVTYEGVHPDDNAERTTVELYASVNPDPRYTYEDGVCLIGEIEIPRSDNARGKSVIINVYFGHTELDVEVIDETTGKCFKEKFDFLL